MSRRNGTSKLVYQLATRQNLKTLEMFAGIVTLAALGYALNRLFLLLENRVLAWHLGATQQSKN